MSNEPRMAGQTSRPRSRRRTLSSLLLLSLGAPPLAASQGGMQVPIRWCAVQGSQMVQNPGCSCAPSTAWGLFFRGSLGSSSYRTCNVLFRPAGQGPSWALPQTVPIIPDPCDGQVNPACPGGRGDVYVDVATGNFFEYQQMIQACRAAWNVSGTSAAGLIGVNVRRFVDGLGFPSNVAGLGGVPQFCSNPSQAVGGAFAVIDDDFTVNRINGPLRMFDQCPAPPPTCFPEVINDTLETLTGHEVGHALSLGHLSNTVMNAFIPATPQVTLGGFGQNALVCPAQPFPAPTSQCGQVRLQAACHQNGTTVDPPPLVDEALDAIGDLPLSPGGSGVEHVDLSLVGLIDDPATGQATFFWQTVGELEPAASVAVYAFAADLDQNPETGGTPLELGLPLPMSGAELAGAVIAGSATDSPSALATEGYFWVHDGASFVAQPTLASGAGNGSVAVDTFTPDIGLEGLELGGVVSLSVPRALAITTDWPPASAWMAAAWEWSNPMLLDQTALETLHMIPPEMPLCELTPAEALPGQPVTVTASGLPPNQPTRVIFFSPDFARTVATGATDPLGNASAMFLVPPEATPGHDTISILIEAPDTAVTADCTIAVLPSGGAAGEASPPGTGEDMRVTSHEPASGDVAITYEPACEATGHAVYFGDLSDVSSYGYSGVACLDASGSATFNLAGIEAAFWVVVGNGASSEGSYGTDANGAERPEDASAVGVCALPQDLSGVCP
jgi:hypothetical protein